MGRVEDNNHLLFPRLLLIAISIIPTVASSIFWYIGDAYDFLSPVEKIIAPSFSLLGLLFSIGFSFFPEKWLTPWFVLYKIIGGTFILVGMVEGALSYESHVRFFLMWLPFYYIGAIFAAATPFQRRFGQGYFVVSTLCVLTAFWLGPLELITEHSIFLVSTVLAQFLLVWILSFIEVRMQQKLTLETEMVAAQKEAEAHAQNALQALREREIAESASRTKSSFISNMSHELRTPLNAMIGFSQILKTHEDAALEKGKIVEYAQDIEASAQHLLMLINDILDLSKIEAGKVELAHDKIKLDDAFEEAIKTVAAMAQHKNIILTQKVADDAPYLVADARALKQIIINLLSNAVKFTPHDGKVTLEALRRSVDGAILVRISDTGIGMTAETLERVLQPFEQGEIVYARQHGGTGLGLSLVKTLTELQGAHLDIESTEGRGTVVTVSFPKP